MKVMTRLFFLSVRYQGGSRYDDWALKKECNTVETLLEFPSVQLTADLLLTQLPALQPVSLSCNAISTGCPYGTSIVEAIETF